MMSHLFYSSVSLPGRNFGQKIILVKTYVLLCYFIHCAIFVSSYVYSSIELCARQEPGFFLLFCFVYLYISRATSEPQSSLSSRKAWPNPPDKVLK